VRSPGRFGRRLPDRLRRDRSRPGSGRCRPPRDSCRSGSR
jgi:hypothetical protein